MKFEQNIIFYHDDPNGLDHSEILDRPCSGTLFAMLQLAKTLSKNNVEVTVISRATDRVVDGIVYIDFSKEKLCDIYRRLDCDAIIFVGRAINDVEQVLKIKKSKVIYWHHNYLPIDKNIDHLRRRDIENIICVSPNHLASLFRYGFVRNVTYIRNPIDLSVFSGFNKRGPRDGYAFVGNVSKDKGFDSIVRIFEQYVDRGGRQKLHVYGSSSLYTGDLKNSSFEQFDIETQNRISKLTAENKLIFHGKLGRKDLYKEFLKRELLLLGLQQFGGAESAGIGAIEAQLMGMNVLTIDRGGQRDSIYNRRFVLPAGDESSIINFLLSGGGGNYSDTKADKYRWFAKRFGNQKRAQEWIDIIDNEGGFKIKALIALFEKIRQFTYNKLNMLFRR